jgi:hypothetical protein
MCTLSFKGLGYNDSFVRNYYGISEIIRSNPDTPIKVTLSLDSICSPCPNNLGNQCKTELKISELDSKHAEILHLKEGEYVPWKEAKIRIKNYMTIEKFHQACSNCEWKNLGICEKTLKELLED